MKKIKRVFLMVLDSVGAGEAPDAHEFGDVGAHTLRSVFESGELCIDNLRRLGIGNIDGLSFLGKIDAPEACVARMRERSRGKDTTAGHWEITGYVSKAPLPTFPNGFPEDIVSVIKEISGREILCNGIYSGIEVIDEYGREALQKGALIVYTSADSVLQIAAHVDVVPLEELYRICGELRARLTEDKQGVGRIIARPFKSEGDGFVRTPDRRDYSLKPPARLLPQAVKESGLSSIAVGKISDIFAGVGFTEAVRTHNNDEGMAVTEGYISKDFEGLCFVNLVDFDMQWGHRRDVSGYAKGLSDFDAWLGRALPKLGEEDLLIITADHGCDPCFSKGTDHTREYTPLIIYGRALIPENFGTRECFSDTGATVAELLGARLECEGCPLELKFR